MRLLDPYFGSQFNLIGDNALSHQGPVVRSLDSLSGG